MLHEISKQKMITACKKVKGEGKVHRRTSHKGPDGDRRYSSTFSLTSALHVSVWLTPRPGHSTSRKDAR